MRITNSMIYHNYQSGLQSTLSGLVITRQQVSTGRRFQDSYEDPNAAAKGVTLENRYARNEDYINAVEDTMKWQDVQEDIVTQINDMAKEIEKNYGIEVLNGTNESERDTYAKLFREMQKSMVNVLNTTYGDIYSVAGNDGLNAPFTIEDDGTVKYRGVDINSDVPEDQVMLEEMAKETAFVDLGFGLNISGGEVVPSSAFNSALPGINIVGFGKDADGVSESMLVLLGDMAEVLEADDFDRDAYVAMWENFGDAADDNRNVLTTIGTKTNLLDSTLTKLENENLNIIEQFDQTINIDEAEAITNFTYQEYVYSLTLKIGSNILTPSLLDFIQ